ncbi:MAG: 16S rRNA (guanine(966)-N(2))-methyltransferase RsmD [Gammaproteobacteria bacterium]
MARKRKTRGHQNTVRIIGGDWRGRRLDFPANRPVRPTPDRVRETLFNWLATKLPGVRCLDLFAGTGVLGFEALSRGAEETWFVEWDPLLGRALDKHAKLLNAKANIVTGDVKDFLATPGPDRFDIIFLDPPYEMPLIPVVDMLPAWLQSSALIYIERPSIEGLSSVGGLGKLWRESRAGQISYGLISVT